MWSATPSRELSIPLSSDAAVHQYEKIEVWNTRLEKERICVSVFRKGPAIETYCVLLPHRENYAIGCGASVIVVYGRSKRESHWQSGHWSLEGLCLGVGSIELKRESIFSSLSVCLSPRPSSASCCMGRHVMLPRWKQSILRMGSFVFSSGPAALTPAFPPFI